MLRVEDLGFGYPGGARMRFELSVEGGEILSLIGPSGSGKSTLLNLIAGFLQADSGRILLDEQPIQDLAVAERPVTMVFQQDNLFPHLDLYTNVALGVDPSLRLDSRQTESVRSALARLGLDGLERRKPGELSGGQRQRVALARALVRRRKILLLDEAFAALGPAQRSELIELARELVLEQGMVALLVSHQPDDALIASARTAFICDGRVAAIAPTAQLLQQPEPPELRDYLGSK
jgi:thiamine transport system ATP-binding protein